MIFVLYFVVGSHFGFHRLAFCSAFGGTLLDGLVFCRPLFSTKSPVSTITRNEQGDVLHIIKKSYIWRARPAGGGTLRWQQAPWLHSAKGCIMYAGCWYLLEVCHSAIYCLRKPILSAMQILRDCERQVWRAWKEFTSLTATCLSQHPPGHFTLDLYLRLCYFRDATSI